MLRKCARYTPGLDGVLLRTQLGPCNGGKACESLVRRHLVPAAQVPRALGTRTYGIHIANRIGCAYELCLSPQRVLRRIPAACLAIAPVLERFFRHVRRRRLVWRHRHVGFSCTHTGAPAMKVLHQLRSRAAPHRGRRTQRHGGRRKARPSTLRPRRAWHYRRSARRAPTWQTRPRS